MGGVGIFFGLWALALYIALPRLNMREDEKVTTWYLDFVADLLFIGPIFWIPTAYLASAWARQHEIKK